MASNKRLGRAIYPWTPEIFVDRRHGTPPNAAVVHKKAPEYRGAHFWFYPALLLVAATTHLSIASECFADTAVRKTLVPYTDGQKPVFALDDIERRKVTLDT